MTALLHGEKGLWGPLSVICHEVRCWHHSLSLSLSLSLCGTNGLPIKVMKDSPLWNHGRRDLLFVSSGPQRNVGV